MQKIIHNLSLLVMVAVALCFNSCRKENLSDASQSAKDATAMSNVLNATGNDADIAAAQVSSIAGKTNGNIHLGALCNSAVITDTSSTNKQITINYTGAFSCNGVIETGTVTIQLTNGNYWRDTGAVLTVTINNLQFTDVATGGTYTLSGAYTITNVNGGLLYDMFVNGASGPIIRRHQTIGSQPITITFANGSSRSWTFDRTRTFTTYNGLINVSLSSQASNNIAMSGTNRYGESFQDVIASPIQATNNPGCLWKPWTGTWQHNIDNKTTTIQFGTDINGNQIGSEGTCASGDGYFITYSNGKRTLTKFVEYWQ
jgi:hypothetical protein